MRGRYYVIDREEQHFRVWERSGAEEVARLVGEYGSLSEAKQHVAARWRPGNGAIEAWAIEYEDPAEVRPDHPEAPAIRQTLGPTSDLAEGRDRPGSAALS